MAFVVSVEGGMSMERRGLADREKERERPMKYMVLIAGPEDRPGQSDADRAAAYQRILAWWEEQSATGKVLAGHELQPSDTATTVRRDAAGNVTVTDGPFVEAKEMVGGYAIIDVADLDEAIALVAGWPSAASLEIRPLVNQDGADPS